MSRLTALALSVLLAGLIAHPSFERPWHGPPSADVAVAVEYRAVTGGWRPDEVGARCRQAPRKRVYACAVDISEPGVYYAEPIELTVTVR